MALLALLRIDAFQVCPQICPRKFREVSLHRISGSRSRGPRPLKVKAAKLAGHIHDFADKKQARNFAALHSFGREFVGVDSASGYLGFLVALGSGRDDQPGMRLTLECGQRIVRE